MDLGGIIPSEINQRKTNTYDFSDMHNLFFLKKKERKAHRTDWWLPQAGSEGQKKQMRGSKG